MAIATSRGGTSRRRLIKAGLALAGAQIASPFVVSPRAAEAVKVGFDNPLTGTYAALGKNELAGCQMALDEINAKGGILGRPAAIWSSRISTSGDAGVAVQKARKLIVGAKVDFLLGNVNSALSLAMAQVSNEKGVLHIVPGGHTDAVTGTTCHWNVFRVCNTTQMEANAAAGALIKQYGKTFYYITPDYAFGHTLEAGLIEGHSGARRREARRRPGAARDRRLLVLSDQGSGGEPGRHRSPHRRRRHGEPAEAGGPVRPRQERSMSPARIRNWSRSRACRRRRGSAPGCWSGTGTSRACRMWRSSSRR